MKTLVINSNFIVFFLVGILGFSLIFSMVLQNAQSEKLTIPPGGGWVSLKGTGISTSGNWNFNLKQDGYFVYGVDSSPWNMNSGKGTGTVSIVATLSTYAGTCTSSKTFSTTFDVKGVITSEHQLNFLPINMSPQKFSLPKASCTPAPGWGHFNCIGDDCYPESLNPFAIQQWIYIDNVEGNSVSKQDAYSNNGNANWNITIEKVVDPRKKSSSTETTGPKIISGDSESDSTYTAGKKYNSAMLWTTGSGNKNSLNVWATVSGNAASWSSTQKLTFGLVAPGETRKIDYQIKVPENTPPGNYKMVWNYGCNSLFEEVTCTVKHTKNIIVKDGTSISSSRDASCKEAYGSEYSYDETAGECYNSIVVKDTDGDGVPNSDDACPSTPGSYDYWGCISMDAFCKGLHSSNNYSYDETVGECYNSIVVKDTDGDGVMNDYDDCPTVVGLSTNNGCPQTKFAEPPSPIIPQIREEAKPVFNAIFDGKCATLHNQWNLLTGGTEIPLVCTNGSIMLDSNNLVKFKLSDDWYIKLGTWAAGKILNTMVAGMPADTLLRQAVESKNILDKTTAIPQDIKGKLDTLKTINILITDGQGTLFNGVIEYEISCPTGECKFWKAEKEGNNFKLYDVESTVDELTKKLLVNLNHNSVYVVGVYSSEEHSLKQDSQTVTTKDEKIPGWIKNNAKWWAEGAIDDQTFVVGLQHLIKENVITVPRQTVTSSAISNEIPAWVKTQTDWWANGQISENEFLNSVEYLMKQGIINLENTTPTIPYKEVFTIKTDKFSYRVGDTMIVSGNVDQVIDGPLHIKVHREGNPDYYIEADKFTRPKADGSFNIEIDISYLEVGNFDVSAEYNSKLVQTFIEIK